MELARSQPVTRRERQGLCPLGLTVPREMSTVSCVVECCKLFKYLTTEMLTFVNSPSISIHTSLTSSYFQSA